MEMPVQVIIILFVVTLVGAMIVLFSQSLIDQSQNQLTEFTSKEKDNKFLEVNSITNSQIAVLVDECYQKSFGEKINNETCFIIHGKNDFTPSENQIKQNLKNKEALGEVTTETTKTIYINWNSLESKVEVKT